MWALVVEYLGWYIVTELEEIWLSILMLSSIVLLLYLDCGLDGIAWESV